LPEHAQPEEYAPSPEYAQAPECAPSRLAGSLCQLDFVPMTAADIAAVVAIEERIQAHPWTAGHFRDALLAGYDAWLARAGEELCGFVLLLRAVDEAQLLVIGVVPEQQRQGLGRALLDFAMVTMRAAGMTRLLLEVRPSNAAALAFYQNTGFVEIGRRRGYYPASTGREDAIVMAKQL
jgi:ribosomal-protein-alanine acetyltransferase